MSDLDSSWKILRKFKYNLSLMENQFRVMDARSAGLPLCIALLNVVRAFNGMAQVRHITGTGILRIDGTFEKSFLEEEKRKASSELMENRFITSQVCKHVFDLATLMNRLIKGDNKMKFKKIISALMLHRSSNSCKCRCLQTCSRKCDMWERDSW